MDNEMANPVNSIIWTPQYFGNGVGDVTSGPAAGWVTNQGRLQRDYGRASRLMSKDNLRQVLTRCRIRVCILFPVRNIPPCSHFLTNKAVFVLLLVVLKNSA